MQIKVAGKNDVFHAIGAIGKMVDEVESLRLPYEDAKRFLIHSLNGWKGALVAQGLIPEANDPKIVVIVEERQSHREKEEAYIAAKRDRDIVIECRELTGCITLRIGWFLSAFVGGDFWLGESKAIRLSATDALETLSWHSIAENEGMASDDDPLYKRLTEFTKGK